VADYDDPSSTYDSGLTYADPVPPQLFNIMKKAKVKLDLFNKTDNDLLPFAEGHETAMTGNPNFTTPLPPVTEFTSVRAAYAAALGTFNTAQAAAKLATTNKDTARAALESALTQRGNYVELTAASAADPVATIQSANFSSRANKTPAGVPPQVMNLAVTAGDHDGELNAQWDPVPGAKTYEVQTSPDPFTATSWSKTKSVTKSSAVLPGFTSGARIWVRVRAIGTGGEGNFSSEISKIVP
jgi:hypothetical protein